ncbi:hypothetical protein BK649P1_00006 [Bacteroides phage BK649P1]|jgi:hypothetical protein|nr:hypothetical protein BK649P1_00006 [Bacteroides phage BK649P1]
MKIKTWYFRESFANYTYSVRAKTIRGALTQIKKKQRECAEKFGHTVFWTIFENEMVDSNIRCILVTYVFSNGDIKQDVL